MRPLFSVLVLALLVPAAAAAGQTELDRIVSRVTNKIITQSDIRQAMMLKLVEDTSSEESTRRGLENRILILAEISRVAGLSAGEEAAFASRRPEWEATLGGRGTLSDLLRRTAMNEGALDTWFRDDARIQAYIKRQFGNVPEGDRAKATADWIARLRQRGGLK